MSHALVATPLRCEPGAEARYDNSVVVSEDAHASEYSVRLLSCLSPSLSPFSVLIETSTGIRYA